MARHQKLPEHQAVEAQDRPRGLDVSDQPIQLGDPNRLTVDEFCSLLRISRATYARALKAGQLDMFEIKPRIGRRAYRRDLVERLNRGELAPVRVFGRRTFGRSA